MSIRRQFESQLDTSSLIPISSDMDKSDEALCRPRGLLSETPEAIRPGGGGVLALRDPAHHLLSIYYVFTHPRTGRLTVSSQHYSKATTFPMAIDLPSSRSVKRPNCCKSSKGSRQIVCGTVIVHRMTAPCFA